MTRPKHTILILGASPSDATRPGLTKEYQAIDAELRKSDGRDEFELRPAWEPRAATLPGLILRHRPEILHFSGHGSDMGELIFEGPDGKSRPADKQTITDVFGALAGTRTIRCVVLNACYSEAQAQQIAKYVDVVIGMRGALRVDSAIAFSAGFYEALGYGCSFTKAFELAKLRIDLEALPDIERPVMHVKDGVDAATAGLPALVSAPSRVGMLVGAAVLVVAGGLSFVFWPDRQSEQSAATSTVEASAESDSSGPTDDGGPDETGTSGESVSEDSGTDDGALDETETSGESVSKTGTHAGTGTTRKSAPENSGTETKDDDPPPPEVAKPSSWTVARVRSVQADDNKRIELDGPQLPSSGILRLSKPVADGRSFVSNVDCRISAGLPPWCMLVHKPGNDGLRAGDRLELVGGKR